DCLIRRRRRHVARAVPDRGPDARSQISAVLVGNLPAAAGRNRDHGSNVCGDVAALRAVLEIRPDHLDLGAESRAAAPGGAGERLSEQSPAVTAIYGLYPDGDRAQR